MILNFFLDSITKISMISSLMTTIMVMWSHILERIFILKTHFIGNHLNVFIPFSTK